MMRHASREAQRWAWRRVGRWRSPGILHGTRVRPGRRQASPSSGRWEADGGPQDQLAGGRSTWSMTWITPFDAMTSGVTTLALSFRYTTPSLTAMAMGEPSTESAEVSPTTWSEVTDPETTWYSRTFLSASLSARSASSVPAGSAAKASSVGANTV